MDESAPEVSTEKETALDRVRKLAALIRDVGVIVGVPALITVGIKLYDIQTKALETQVKANEAQIKALEAQNSVLKETQYDRALALIKSQREVFLVERASLEKQISDLQAAGRTAETGPLVAQLQAKQNLANLSSALVAAYEACAGRAIQRANPMAVGDCSALLLQQVYANTKPKEAAP